MRGWYEQQRLTLQAPVVERLGRYGPEAHEAAVARYDAQVQALREVAQARHRGELDRVALLADEPPGTVRMENAETVRWARTHVEHLREEYVRTVETARVAASAAGLVAPPAYADADDWRAPAWQDAQRTLHQRYAEILARPDTADADADAETGDGAAAGTRVESGPGTPVGDVIDDGTFDEAFRVWAGDKASVLTEEQLTAVREQVRTEHARLSAITSDTGAAVRTVQDAFTVAAVRQRGLAHAEAAFERTFHTWWQETLAASSRGLTDGTGASFEPAGETAGAVHDRLAAEFHDRVDRLVDRSFTGIDPERALDGTVRQAVRDLRDMIAPLPNEFDRRLHLLLLDPAFEAAVASFPGHRGAGSGALTAAEHTPVSAHEHLLSAFAAEGTPVSGPGRARVLDDARRALDDVFDRFERPGAGTDDRAASIDRQTRLDAVVGGLHLRLAEQAVREHQIVRVQEAVQAAAASWAETGPRTDAAFLDRFPVDFGSPGKELVAELGVTMAVVVNQRLDQVLAETERLGPQERAERWQDAYRRLTDPERLHTWLTVRHARDRIGELAEELLAAHLTQWRDAHGDRPLGEADTARVRAGLEERLRSAFDVLHPRHTFVLDDVDALGRRWDAVLAAEAQALPAHLAFESTVGTALHGAARSFEALRGDRETEDDRFAALGGDFRRDFLDAYETLWAPQKLSSAWATHEAAHADSFTTGLTAARLHALDPEGSRDARRTADEMESRLRRTYDEPDFQELWDRANELLGPRLLIGRDPETVALREAQHRALFRLMGHLGREGDERRARDLARALVERIPGIGSLRPGVRGGAGPRAEERAEERGPGRGGRGPVCRKRPWATRIRTGRTW